MDRRTSSYGRSLLCCLCYSIPRLFLVQNESRTGESDIRRKDGTPILSWIGRCNAACRHPENCRVVLRAESRKTSMLRFGGPKTNTDRRRIWLPHCYQYPTRCVLPDLWTCENRTNNALQRSRRASPTYKTINPGGSLNAAVRQYRHARLCSADDWLRRQGLLRPVGWRGFRHW